MRRSERKEHASASKSSQNSYYGNMKIPKSEDRIQEPGWRIVEPKKKKKSEAEGVAAAEEKREEEKEKIPSLRLRPIDWDIPVLRQDQVNDRTEGVCLWDQDDRAQQAADLLDGECDVKCVMVTSGPLESTTNPSVKFDLQAVECTGEANT